MLIIIIIACLSSSVHMQHAARPRRRSKPIRRPSFHEADRYREDCVPSESMEPTAAGSPCPGKRAKRSDKYEMREKASSKGSSPSGRRSHSHSRSRGMTPRKETLTPRSVDGASPLSGGNANWPAPTAGKRTPGYRRKAKERRHGARSSPRPQRTDNNAARYDGHEGFAPTPAVTTPAGSLASSAPKEVLPCGSTPLYLKQCPSRGFSPPVGSLSSPSLSLHNQLQKNQSVSTWGSRLKARRLRLWTTIIAIASVILIVIGAIGLVMSASTGARSLASTCPTFACKEYSKRLRASVNTSVDPCVSFTRFVCDGWKQKNQLDVWQDQFLDMLHKLNATLRNIVWPPEGQNAEQRAAAVYQSCSDVFLGKSDELPAVKSALADAGIVWPRPSKDADALYTLLYCSLKLGWGTLLDFKVEHAGDARTLVVSEGKSAFLLHRIQDTPRTTAEKKACFELLEETFKDTESDTVSYELLSSYDKAISSMLALAHYRYTAPSPFENVLTKATRINLTELRWTEALKNVNASLHAQPLVISTTNLEYISEIVSVWNEYGEGSFHSLISWCTVQIAALYANRNLILNFYGGDEEKAVFLHTTFCVSRAAFFSPHATFARYNRLVLRGYGEAMAREIALSVRSSVYRQLSSWPQFNEKIMVIGNWSSLDTMFSSFEHAEEKLAIPNSSLVDMTRSFVKNWQRSVLFNTTPAVETLVRNINYLQFYSFNEEETDFQLTPYAFSYPLFDKGLPPSVNYGGLGDEVATALGNFILAAYEFANVTRIQAFYDCLQAGPYGSVWSSNNYPARIITLGAVIKAYQASGYAALGPVPGFEHYDGLQTFFIARGYADCEGSAGSYDEDSRNFPLLYTPEFAEAFKCSPEDPMIARRQCRLEGW